jgi:hypothetical protein
MPDDLATRKAHLTKVALSDRIGNGGSQFRDW